MVRDELRQRGSTPTHSGLHLINIIDIHPYLGGRPVVFVYTEKADVPMALLMYSLRKNSCLDDRR